MSEQETINAILTQNPITVEPQSRGEKILRNIVNGEGTEGLEYPQNRGEAYLYRIAKNGEIPHMTLDYSQVIGTDPLKVQLTDEQYESVAEAPFVDVDSSALGIYGMSIFTHTASAIDTKIVFYSIAYGMNQDDSIAFGGSSLCVIDKETKILTFSMGR